MTEREFEETNDKFAPLVGQASEERRTEAILRRAAVWEAETPEPVGLAHRALTKKGVLRPANDRRGKIAVGPWWGAGTLGVASALAALLYVHPISLDTADATPVTRKLASPESQGAKTENSVSPPAPDALVTEKNEATDNAAKQQARPIISGGAKHPRSSAHRALGRRIPETTYRPKNRTYLAHRERPSRRHEAAPPTAPRPTGGETVGASQLAAHTAPPDAAPSNYRALVPVVLTRESEDGSEIIATPALLEVAYEPTPQK